MKTSLYILTALTSLLLSAVGPASAQSWNITGNANATNTSKLGTTNAIPLRFFTNNIERLRIDATGKVGIGTTTPLNPLTIQLNGTTPNSLWLSGGSSLPAFIGFGENQATGFNLATAANPAGYRPVLNTRRSRGTLAAPAAVANNDYLASFVSSGFDGTTFQNPATIDFYVDSVPTAGNVPARISFVTGSNASNRAERLKIGNGGNFYFNNKQFTIIQASGKIGIGTDAPVSTLHVIGNGLFTAGLLVNDGGITVTNSNGFGVKGTGTIGVYGAGGNTGVYGIGLKYGVYGDGKEYGLYGNSDNGFGIFGVSNLNTGTGVRGEATGLSAIGVFGLGGSVGVAGSTSKAGGVGVQGEVHAANSTGVFGSGELYGVHGYTASDAGISIWGDAAGANSIGVFGNGGVAGVKGMSKNDKGIWGVSTGSLGFGVAGSCQLNVGVYGEGRLGVGGYSNIKGGRGVDGEVTAPTAYGVYGYNSTPSDLVNVYYAGYFDGPVGSTGGYWNISDRKLKQNVNDIPNAMDIIKKLHPKTYDFRHDGNYRLMNLPSGNHYGLIAQEVEQVLPNLVRNATYQMHTALSPNEQGENRVSAQPANTEASETIEYKTINYTPLISIVIKGMQEELAEIDELKSKVSEVDALKREVAELRQLLLDIKNGTSQNSVPGYLQQNNPNPASGITTIRYFVPGSAESVQLTITDAAGRLVKTITPGNASDGQVSFSIAGFAAGVYNYTLWVQGKQADTKRMIIGK